MLSRLISWSHISSCARARHNECSHQACAARAELPREAEQPRPRKGRNWPQGSAAEALPLVGIPARGAMRARDPTAARPPGMLGVHGFPKAD